jgi:hypothetical protein
MKPTLFGVQSSQHQNISSNSGEKGCYTMKRLYSRFARAYLLVSLFYLTGCSALTSPGFTPTIDPQAVAGTVSAVQTAAVQTVFAQFTQSAELTPSATLTPQPSSTPQETNTLLPTNTLQPSTTPSSTPVTPTPTRTYIPATAVPTQGAYQCSITSLSPTSGTTLTDGVDFDLNVTLTNTGTKTWSHTSVDFQYLSGAKFQKRVDAIDLTKDIDPGKSVKLIVDMLANTGTGTQSALWSLVRSGLNFCQVNVRVIVQ